MMSRYPLRVFYPNTSVLVRSADEELALTPGWAESPEAFTPGYVPKPEAPYVPTADPAVLASLSEASIAQLRAQAEAVRPTTVPDSKLAAIEQQFEQHAIKMIEYTVKIQVLEAKVKDLEALVGVLDSRVQQAIDAVRPPFDTGAPPEAFVPPSMTAEEQAEDMATLAAMGTASDPKPKGKAKK